MNNLIKCKAHNEIADMAGYCPKCYEENIDYEMDICKSCCFSDIKNTERESDFCNDCHSAMMED